nr:hypothetical protein [Desulfobacula sp.]
MTELEINQSKDKESPEQKDPATENKTSTSQPNDIKESEEDQPKYKQDKKPEEIVQGISDRKKTKKSPRQILRDCLWDCFTGIEEIVNFCYFHTEFETVCKNAKEKSFETLIRIIIEHCNGSPLEEHLWESIRQDEKKIMINIIQHGENLKGQIGATLIHLEIHLTPLGIKIHPLRIILKEAILFQAMTKLLLAIGFIMILMNKKKA